MDADLILAILHHLLVFSLMAMLAVELTLLRPGLSPSALRTLGGVDGGYGVVAGLIIVVGILRVIFGAKGWGYYLDNWAFWAKMASFAVVGLLSIPPTLAILRWRKNRKSDPACALPDGEIASMRRFLLAEAVLFLLIPSFAAIMARL